MVHNTCIHCSRLCPHRDNVPDCISRLFPDRNNDRYGAWHDSGDGPVETTDSHLHRSQYDQQRDHTRRTSSICTGVTPGRCITGWFWGLHSDGKTITVPAGIHVYCSKRDVSEWALRIAVSIEGDNNSYTLPCPARTSAKMATDTLTLRHASPLPVAPTEDKLQLQISHTRGILFNDGALPVAADDSRSHDLNIHAWYIDEQSSEQGLPGLYRLSLVKGGSMQHQEIMPGVENLQIQFGVDRNTDGIIDGFVEPDEVTDNLIHAVQISIQMRSAHPETGYVNKEPYTDDNYRRLSATRTVWLRNS
jgi:hypothetical protein